MPKFVPITVEVSLNVGPEAAWKALNDPEFIVKWCFAIDTWHCPWAKNDLRVGGHLSSRMEAKDGSFGFDFGGTYTEVDAPRRLAYTMGDGRAVSIEFRAEGTGTRVVETFDAEGENSLEQQRSGWQSILDNYKRVAEGTV